MTSLAIVDPSPQDRSGLAAAVTAFGHDPIYAQASLDELINRADRSRPDLMLIRLRGAAPEIAPLMGEIRAWAPEAKAVFVAAALDLQALAACFAAGASGYLVEPLSTERLEHSLRLVTAGEKVFPSELAEVLREGDILRYLANGYSNRAIAEKLGISQAAVRADIRRILAKLRLSNRRQAAEWAQARGLGREAGANAPAGTLSTGRGRPD
jgi:two-component system nitrate/nitrite response regulator NarL